MDDGMTVLNIELSPLDKRIDNAELVVAFSGGVESTAVLNHAVNTHGKDRVCALTTLVYSENGRLPMEMKPQYYYTKKITEYYDIPHIITHRIVPPRGLKVPQGVHFWTQDLAFFCTGNLNVKQAWYGFHRQDNLHRSAVLAFSYFDVMMLHANSRCSIGAPLQYLTKKEHYDTIPASVKEWVWTCSRYKHQPGTSTFIPCGKCHKCQEFNNQVTNYEA